MSDIFSLYFLGASRSKIRNDFQYQLNPKGSTLAEIMGVDHKTLKSELKSRADDLKRRYMENSEQKIILQETSSSQAARIEGKRNDIAALQSLIDDVSDSCLEPYTNDINNLRILIFTMQGAGFSSNFLLYNYDCR